MAAGDRTYEAWHSRWCLRGEVPCTLPDKPSAKHETSQDYTFRLAEYRGRFWLQKIRCYWSPGPYIGKHSRIKSDCGCSMCTMKRERREMNRRDRHNAKKQIRKERDE